MLGAKNVTVLHAYDPEADAYAGALTEKLFWEVLKRYGVIGGTSAGASIQGNFLARGGTRNNQTIVAEHQETLDFSPGILPSTNTASFRSRQFDVVDTLNIRPKLLGINIDEKHRRYCV
ncbi:hypothetical protein DL771_010222 [Monosporascus sp. 5C6A]|nr:hypothetical protein DL771_010222 [Monosporascus sp. 5C6A]